MTILNRKDSVVLMIDIQERLLKAAYNSDLIEKNSVILTKAANVLEIPILVTEQYPQGLGDTILPIKETLDDDTKYYEKVSFSALENLELKESLENLNKKQVVIFGIETHICVSQTAEALCNLGYEVHVVVDASGSRNEIEHNAGIRRMNDNGVYSVTTEIVLFEWLKSARNIKFKDIQSLIK